MISLAIAAVAFFALSFWANQLLLSVLPKPIYLAVLFPGVVIHELSHLIFAVLTGTPVTEVQLFSASGGHIKHAQPKIPVLGQFIISFAPLVVGLIAIYFLLQLLPLGDNFLWQIPYSSFKLSVPMLTSALVIFDYIYIYLILSIALTFLPSYQDLLTSIPGIIVAIFILVLLFINNWISIPEDTAGIIWYINTIFTIIVVVLLPIKMMLKKR